jgi:hypothetical protein
MTMPIGFASPVPPMNRREERTKQSRFRFPRMGGYETPEQPDPRTGNHPLAQAPQRPGTPATAPKPVIFGPPQAPAGSPSDPMIGIDSARNMGVIGDRVGAAPFQPAPNPYLQGGGPLSQKIKGLGFYNDQLFEAGRHGVPGGGLMDNTQAQAMAGRNGLGFMPSTTVGGAYGGPSVMDIADNRLSSRQVLDQGRGNPFATTGATPLGGMAMNQDQLNSAKLAGHGLGGGVAVRDPNGQVRLQFEPPKEFGPMPGSESRVYEPGVGLRGYKAGETLRPNADQQKRAAAALASNTKGPSPSERKQAVTDRNAARIAGRGNAYELAQAKKESRQLNKGVLTFDQRLAAANPAAYQQRQAVEADSAGRLGLAKSQSEQRAQEAKDRIALGDRQIAAGTERAKLGLSAAAIRAGEPDPNAPAKPKAKAFSDDDYRTMAKADAVEHMKSQDLSPSEINRRMNAIHGTSNHNWYLRPEGPGIFSGETPVGSPPTPAIGSKDRAKFGAGMGLPPAPRPSPFELRERERMKREGRGRTARSNPMGA